MYRVRFTAWFEDPAIGAQFDMLVYQNEPPEILDWLWNTAVRPQVYIYCPLAGPVYEWKAETVGEEPDV